MDSTVETKPQDDELPFSSHPSDPDGVVLPPPTTQQMAQGRIRCKVYNREEWGGRAPKETPVMYTPVTKVVLSRTETEPCFTHEDCRLRIRQMQNVHMDEEGEPDIKYHFLVGGDGALYEGRGYTTVGRSYPVTSRNLQDLSKSCLEIAFIQKSDTETSEEMQKTASDCITLGRHANHIYKTFDLYFVANNDIVHTEQMGELNQGEENITLQSNEEKLTSNTSSEVSQESSPSQLDSGQFNMETSPFTGDRRPMDTQDSATENNNASLEHEFEKDESGKPEMIETGTTEFATHSNVPLHDSPDGEETKDDKEEIKPVNFVYRHVWGALMPKTIKALNLPINKVAVSFTESEPCYTQDECMAAVRKLQVQHMEEKDEPDIKHNFLIGGDGQIYEGRGYTRVGPIYPPSPRKIEELNGKSIDIGIIESHAVQPSNKMVEAISWCLSTGIHKNFIEKNFDTYYIANKEIIHIQHPVAGAKSKT